jgi:hypothetical protein
LRRPNKKQRSVGWLPSGYPSRPTKSSWAALSSTWTTKNPNPEEIIRKTIRLGCNPGNGSVQIQTLPKDEIPERFKNRLLTADEADLLNVGGAPN